MLIVALTLLSLIRFMVLLCFSALKVLKQYIWVVSDDHDLLTILLTPGFMVKWSKFFAMVMVKFFDHDHCKNHRGEMFKIGQFWPLTKGKFQGVMVMDNFRTIDHIVYSRVSWSRSRSVPYPPPKLIKEVKIVIILIIWNYL